MKFTDYIFQQVDGFNKAAKKIVKPKNNFEKFNSKLIAGIILLFVVLFYVSLYRFGSGLPLRIHIRAWIYFLPLLAAAVKFYQGISLSWMMRGLLKYWMIPLMLIWIYLVVMNMFYVAFFDGNYHIMLVFAGLMSMYIGLIYFVYFRKKASRSFLYYVPALFVLALFIGGVIMLLWGAGVLDWFHNRVLGW